MLQKAHHLDLVLQVQTPPKNMTPTATLQQDTFASFEVDVEHHKRSIVHVNNWLGAVDS